jgi:hypothetical protein
VLDQTLQALPSDCFDPSEASRTPGFDGDTPVAPQFTFSGLTRPASTTPASSVVAVRVSTDCVEAAVYGVPGGAFRLFNGSDCLHTTIERKKRYGKDLPGAVLTTTAATILYTKAETFSALQS